MTLMVYRRHMADPFPPKRQLDRYCSRGTRAFFAKRGWDWSHFLRNGRPAADFIATGDAMAVKCAHNAERERDGR